MVKWLHKLLFVAISLSFVLSATEMDLGECHQTFFDQYDTYIKSEQVAVDQAPLQQQQQELFAFVSFLYHYCSWTATSPAPFPKDSPTTANTSPPKLFLHNSVWRI